MLAVIFFAGQLFVHRNLVTGYPPEISEATITNQSVVQDISQGPGIIYFWADWCGICRLMKDPIKQVFQDYTGISVAMRSGDAEKIRQYLHQEGLDWATVADEQGHIGSRFGVKGVPTVFFLGRDGEIKLTSVGYTSETGLRLRLWLAGLL